MRIRTVLLFILIVLFLLNSTILAQSYWTRSPSRYIVHPGTTSSGKYKLTNPIWFPSGETDGGGYRLDILFRTLGTGTPCCCIYLPCLMQNN